MALQSDYLNIYVYYNILHCNSYYGATISNECYLSVKKLHIFIVLNYITNSRFYFKYIINKLCIYFFESV